MSNDESFVCALEGCEVAGTKTTHNQKYCSQEHCRIATNAKIMDRYHELKAIKNGSKRVCTSCDTILSRYNRSKMCSGCENKGRAATNERVANLGLLVS